MEDGKKKSSKGGIQGEGGQNESLLRGQMKPKCNVESAYASCWTLGWLGCPFVSKLASSDIAVVEAKSVEFLQPGIGFFMESGILWIDILEFFL